MLTSGASVFRATARSSIPPLPTPDKEEEEGEEGRGGDLTTSLLFAAITYTEAGVQRSFVAPQKAKRERWEWVVVMVVVVVVTMVAVVVAAIGVCST